MRLSNINTQALSNILGSAGFGKKGFILFRTAKARVITGALALLTVGGVAAGAYNYATHSNQDADIPTVPPVVAGNSDTSTDTPVVSEQFSILADDLSIDGLGMQNTMLTVEEQAAKIAEEFGATYQGDTYTSTGKDGSTQTWASEDDYKKAEEAGIAGSPAGTETVHYDQNVFVADDGTVFSTAADRDAWNQQLKNGNKGTGAVETEGNYYTAPDGTIWTSEAEYQNFIKGQSTTTAADTETIVEAGTGYRDPNGDYWASEAEYLAYVESLGQNNNQNKHQNNNENNNQNNNNQNNNQNYEDNYYHAPDGSVWASEAEYLSFINSSQQSSTGTTTPEPEETENNYYTAPDGSIWASEAEYLSFINSTQQNAATVSAAPEAEETENNYYTAPDGTIWTSEADYLAFMAMEAENSKTR